MTETEAEPKITEFLRNIIAAITQFTHQPKITNGDGGYSIWVEPEDQGRVVGKQGMTIWAISTALTFASIQQTGRQSLWRLMEPDTRANGPKIPFRPRADWNRSVVEILMEALAMCFTHMTYELVDDDGTHSTIIVRPAGDKSQFTMHHMDLSEAMRVLVKATGMAHGAVLDLQIEWEK